MVFQMQCLVSVLVMCYYWLDYNEQEEGAMELVTPKLRKIWKNWKLRSMVLTSPLVHIVLIVFSSRRKYIRRAKFRATVWCSYLWLTLLQPLPLAY
ncbi:hypothetical protein V6N11_016992 [Hibiscus sabdariffa]|uniref:Uncharacterized protein n=1 Tax=Hibiscus sabdariffa TaxID=183260 RepID=A0ABR2TX90_9ROSI